MINLSSNSLFDGSLLPVIPIKQIRQKELHKNLSTGYCLTMQNLRKR